MNGKQKAVLIAGFVLILATGAYPPWMQSWQFPTGSEDAWHRIDRGAEGYSWLFQPPAVPNWVDSTFQKPGDPDVKEDMKKVLVSLRTPGTWRAQIDLRRVSIEWGIILAGVFAGILGFARKGDLRKAG